MDIKKLAPWNWFKKEDEETGSVVPVQISDDRFSRQEDRFSNPIVRLHREVDRIFENAFRNFGVSSFGTDRSSTFGSNGLLKPSVEYQSSCSIGSMPSSQSSSRCRKDSAGWLLRTISPAIQFVLPPSSSFKYQALRWRKSMASKSRR